MKKRWLCVALALWMMIMVSCTGQGEAVDPDAKADQEESRQEEEALKQRYEAISEEQKAALTRFCDRICRWYYDVGGEEPITQAMREGITSLMLIHSEIGAWSDSESYESEEGREYYTEKIEIQGKTYYYTVDATYIDALPNYRQPEKGRITSLYTGDTYEAGELAVWDHHIDAIIQENGASGPAGRQNVQNGCPYWQFVPKNFMEKNLILTIEDDWTREKLSAYYMYVDYAEPEMDTALMQELAAEYPAIQDIAVYMCDPEMRPREKEQLMRGILEHCEAAPEELTVEEDILAYYLRDYFPCLTTIEYACQESQ